MTITNGGRVVEHLDGVVQSFNERGVHLVGEDTWRNFSRYAGTLPTPAQGQRVRLGLDGSGFVRELQVLDGPSAAAAAEPASTSLRVAALQAAATFAAGKALNHDVSSADVLKVAESFERWLLEV